MTSLKGGITSMKGGIIIIQYKYNRISFEVAFLQHFGCKLDWCVRKISVTTLYLLTNHIHVKFDDIKESGYIYIMPMNKWKLQQTVLRMTILL